MTDRIPTTGPSSTDDEEVCCESCFRTDCDLVCGECGYREGSCNYHLKYLYCVSCWRSKDEDRQRVFPLYPHL